MVFSNWINKLFSEENKVPRKLLEARKVAGSATYNTSTTGWIGLFSLCLFILFFDSKVNIYKYVC